MGCAKIAESESAAIKRSFTDDGCKIISAAEGKGYYVGIDNCLTDNALKAALQARIKNHKVMRYTENSTAFTGYEFITKAFVTLGNVVYDMPTRFDVWDAYVLFAAKGANPYKSGANCAVDRILDWYDYQCYQVPTEIMSASTGGQQNPGSADALAAPVANFGVIGLYDRAHGWPASWFRNATQDNNPSGGSYCYDGNNDSSYDVYADYRAVTDLHHLVPGRRSLNGALSNFAPGIVAAPDANFPRTNGMTFGTPNAGAMTGFPGATGVTAKVWTPAPELRGDFARNYFYMATRYYTEDSCWQTNNAVTKANINTWLENVLRQWHSDDPVSAEEITRNDWVQRIQGNRNPFVDHPEWVAKISDF